MRKRLMFRVEVVINDDPALHAGPLEKTWFVRTLLDEFQDVAFRKDGYQRSGVVSAHADFVTAEDEQ